MGFAVDASKKYLFIHQSTEFSRENQKTLELYDSVIAVSDNLCEKLKKDCGEVIYDIWFKPLEIVSFDGTKAEIAASEFVKRIIEQK